MRIYNLFLNHLMKVLSYISALVIVTMSISVFTNVVARYVFNTSFPWLEELARYELVFLSFVGAIVVLHHNEHLNLDLFIEKLNIKMQKTLAVFTNLILVGVLSLVTYYGYLYAEKNMDLPTPAMEIPTGLVFGIIPFTSMLMIFVLVNKILKVFLGGEDS